MEITFVLVVENLVNYFIDMVSKSDEDVAIATTCTDLRNEREIFHA